jgi:hypothetical protein
VWYPVFSRHEIHRHLAHQVGGCGVFSRSASTWATIVSCVFASVLTMRVVAKFVVKSLMAWRPSGKLANRRSAISALGASWRSPGPFVVRLGCRASGRTCRLASMDRQIPSSSCSTTQSTFRWSEATAHHSQLVPDGHEGRASPVALGVAPGVHFILERLLRVLPRQIRSLGAGARGSVGIRGSQRFCL